MHPGSVLETPRGTPKQLQTAEDGPRTAQNAPQDRPRGAQDGPRDAQDGPRRPDDGPQRQHKPKQAQDATVNTNERGTQAPITQKLRPKRRPPPSAQVGHSMHHGIGKALRTPAAPGGGGNRGGVEVTISCNAGSDTPWAAGPANLQNGLETRSDAKWRKPHF